MGDSKTFGIPEAKGLIFSSILRQITTYQNASFLRKLRISNSWKHCVDVCKSSVSSSYTVWTSFVLRSTQNHTRVCKHLQSGTSHCSPIVWTVFFQWCPHWFCTQNKTGDSTPTGDCCPSIGQVPGLNAYTNAHTHTYIDHVSKTA